MTTVPEAFVRRDVGLSTDRAGLAVSHVGKRVLDVTLALILLIVAAPLMLLVAALVRLTSSGPALYSCTRVGLDGRHFRFLKFRSMYRDAAQREELWDLNDLDQGVLFKIRNDPRVTPVGRVLRKLSIDELPQLLHVLSGSMSLVGPRPHFPEDVMKYAVADQRRLSVKPGITGLWQVSGRDQQTWDDAVHLDLQYVDNWSIWLDMKILARTCWVVVRSKGAY